MRRERENWFTRLKLWQRISLISLGVILLLFLGVIIYIYSKLNKIDTQKIRAEDIVINEEVKLNRELDLGEGYKNVALFGVDSRDGNLGEGNRTDCIIVASLNNETKEIKMVSVYRDTLLNLSEGTYQKCNAAYSYGGPVMAINMLNMNLDLDIEDYVTVDFGAIADAIDLLGGVEIDLTEEELPYLNQYLTETANSAGKQTYFIGTPGLQLLDGVQATTYARIRSTAGGDFTRTERQRLVIEKMFEKARTADLGTINEIIDKVFPQVSTSFTIQEILMYASAYSDYTLSDNMGFPVDKSTDTVSGLGSIVIPENLSSNVTKLHEFLFGTAGYTPSSTVQNINSNIQYTVNSVGSESSDNENYNRGDSGGYGEINDASSSQGNEAPSTAQPPADSPPNQEESGTGPSGGSGPSDGESGGSGAVDNNPGNGGTGSSETENSAVPGGSS